MGFARPTLTDVREFGEYATTFRWNIYFVTQPTGLVVTPGQFNCLCESTDLPNKTVDKILVAIRGHKHYQPGIVAPAGTITMNFVENINNDGSKIFQQWQELIWAHNVGTGVPYNDLVGDVAIERLDNTDTPICTYVLRYCFLESYTLPRLDGTTSGPFTASMTLAYDDFYSYGTNITTPPNLTLRNNP